ncbi:hypothetical protein BSZ39_13010 [Bowdeniella nasicola]|uniref:Transposase n=1 Tax=Bowdeniella nasicola TaxID=208480 RepID=A0A1Q5PT14_9ACTO|nr:hypothetical protein BSZ39_13010 [Bowdeniella nasicola]
MTALLSSTTTPLHHYEGLNSTLARWRRDYGEMNRTEAKELKRLREENSKLKALLGEAELEKAALKELVEGEF